MSWSRGTSNRTAQLLGGNWGPRYSDPGRGFLFFPFPDRSRNKHTHRRVYIPIDAHHHRLRHSAPRLQGNRALALAITLAITLA